MIRFKKSIFLKRVNQILKYNFRKLNELIENSREELVQLKASTLYRIFSNEKIKLNDEDQLLSFVNECYKRDHEYVILYDLVYFEQVTSKIICEFISEFDFNDMMETTWESICRRLKFDIKNDQKIENRYINKLIKNEGEFFSPNSDKDFSGIISFLLKKSDGKIENEIEITSSSCHLSGSKYLPKVVALFKDNSFYFISKDEQNSWLCLDFKERKIKPTHYIIKGRQSENDHQPKSWVIEVSNDNQKFEVIDEKRDNSQLNKNPFMHTFKIDKEIKESFRYIRIRQIGPSWAGHNYLVINSFELYGTLI